MIDPGLIAIIVGLFVVVIVEFVFLMLVLEMQQKEKSKLLEENSRLVKALISKNAHEYVMTTSIDKVPEEAPVPKDPDEIPEEAMSDDQFFRSIGKSLEEDTDK